MSHLLIAHHATCGPPSPGIVKLGFAIGGHNPISLSCPLDEKTPRRIKTDDGWKDALPKSVSCFLFVVSFDSSWPLCTLTTGGRWPMLRGHVRGRNQFEAWPAGRSTSGAHVEHQRDAGEADRFTGSDDGVLPCAIRRT